MQEKIEKIILNNIFSKKEKIENLKKLFFEENIYYFSDFDDTLSKNNCVFYTKVKILKKYKKYNLKNIEKILEDFSINKNFEIKNQKIILISRNDYFFLKKFLEKFRYFLKEKNIEIIWVIWQTIDFKYSSYEKLLFLNENNFFIGDEFEDEKLKNYKNFILVKKLNFLEKIFIKIKKIFILIKFILKWI